MTSLVLFLLLHAHVICGGTVRYEYRDEPQTSSDGIFEEREAAQTPCLQIVNSSIHIDHSTYTLLLTAIVSGLIVLAWSFLTLPYFYEKMSKRYDESQQAGQQKLYISKQCGECLICFERFTTIYAALPCGHTGVCVECRKQTSRCSICNNQISGYLEINM